MYFCYQKIIALFNLIQKNLSCSVTWMSYRFYFNLKTRKDAWVN